MGGTCGLDREMRNEYRVFVEKHKGKRWLRKPDDKI
jgi:hypothetical protein